MTQITGGCLCGAVRFTVSNPLATVACHCTHCRKQSGSAFSVNVLAAASEVVIEGSTELYADKGESGADVGRRFCGDCGSPIYSVLGAMPGMIAVKAGLLDEPGQVSPTMQIYCDSAVPWASLESAGLTFPRAAPAAPEPG